MLENINRSNLPAGVGGGTDRAANKPRSKSPLPKGIDGICSACVCCTVDFSYKKSVLNTGIMLICPWSNNILEISSY